MGGDIQQYQIRTMARDLERARGEPFGATYEPSSQATLPPKKAAEVRPPSVPREQRKLQDILAEARARVTEAPKPARHALEDEAGGTSVFSATLKTLADILPIEPFDAVQGSALRSPAGRDEGGPPSNLPTGEPSLAFSPPEEKTTPSSSAEIRQRTPEEILGLPASPKAPTSPPQTPPLLTKERGGGGEVARPVKAAASRLQADLPPKKVRSFPALKFVLLSGFLAIVIIGLGYGIYWKISREEAPPAPPSAPKISEQPAPEALIQSRDTGTIELSGLDYDSLKPKIDALGEAKFLPQSLAYIPIKFFTEKETRYLTLSEIFEVLQIDAPPILYDHKNFTLYLYSQGPEDRKLCDEAGIISKSCYGPRIGIVIEFPDPEESVLTPDAALTIMGEWEKTIIDDLGPLMLAVPRKTGAQFARGKYKSFDTSFVNLPISTTSIDWILTDTHLIIATSKDAARAALDALK